MKYDLLEGRAQIVRERLSVYGWCELQLAPVIFDFVESWLAGHGCSAFPEERVFRVKLGSHHTDCHIEMECRACGRKECVFGDDFAERLESVRAAAKLAGGERS